MEAREREKGLVEYVRKASAPPFLVKTYTVVDDPASDEVISWNGDGTAFVVWQPVEFARDLLPTIFKHNNLSSFVRQLNTYGFRKVATNRWEFSNDMFRKGERDQLYEIRRRKAQPNVQAEAADDGQTSSSSVFTTLIDENEKLKQENGVLNSELAIMKKKCKELLDMVAVHGGGREVKVAEEGPKLFGVRLGVLKGEMEKKRKMTREISKSRGLLIHANN